MASGLFKIFSSALMMEMTNYCNIETADGKYDLVNKDGCLVSVISIEGCQKIIGKHNFDTHLADIESRLSGVLSKPGYKLQFVFTRDPSLSRRLVDSSISQSITKAKSVGLDFKSMLDERGSLLAQKTCFESAYLVVTTTPNIFPPVGAKQAINERNSIVKKAGGSLEPGQYGQSPFVAIPALRQSHASMVKTIIGAFVESTSMVVLEVHDALKAIKSCINPEFVSNDWRPSLPGDKTPYRLDDEMMPSSDISHVMYPPIAHQLFNQSPEIDSMDHTIVKVGCNYIAPLLVDVSPEQPKPFSNLLATIDRDIPWRFSITIRTGQNDILKKIATKNTLVSILAFSSSQNRLIKSAIDELTAFVEEGAKLVSMNMAFATWSSSREKTMQNKATLAQAIQSWGSTDVIEERGDCVKAWLESVPGILKAPISTQVPTLLSDALYMIPFTRPTSPWSAGPVLFRTIDEKLYPFVAGSSKQTLWSDIVFAPPGYGKSVFLAASNTGMILAGGGKMLPRISIIDIGFSSAQFVNMIKSALPERDRHLAQSFKMDSRINPFDTPLGCRKPLSVDREFLCNFLSLLLTPAGKAGGVTRLSELVSNIIDSMYNYFSDENNPNVFEPGIDKSVDEALAKHAIHIPEGQSWWFVVDRLFDSELTKEASLAQRYAVPTLNDATAVLSSDSTIQDVFGEAKSEGESLLKYLSSMIISAIKDYPILAGPSVFDIGSARIASIDLSNVAKTGSAQADKKTGVMYMLARYSLCKEFYRNLDDTLPEIPPKYLDYHRSLIEMDATTPKKICMDEFHRTQHCAQVREQAVVDLREGRKFNVHISLLSQRLDDFDDAIIELSTNVFILSKGMSEDSLQKIISRFALSEDAVAGLRRHVTGPSKEGSSFLYLGNLKNSTGAEQILRLTLGPMEMWAYSTTHEDNQIRRILTERLGLSAALRILAKEFPGGSAKAYIEDRIETDDFSDDEENTIFKIIARELSQKHPDLH